MNLDDNNDGFTKLQGISKHKNISRKERLKNEKLKEKAVTLNDKLEAKIEKKITRLNKKVK